MTQKRAKARRRLLLTAVPAIIVVCACSSKILKTENSGAILKNEEFDQAIKVEALPTPAPAAAPSDAASGSARPRLQSSGLYVSLPGPEPVPGAFPKKKGKKDSAATASPGLETGIVHEPASVEDGEGFIGRRPAVDPFRVGEKVTFEVSYFGVEAGTTTLEVHPFVQVNGRRSYKFVGTTVSTSVFAMFYAVDDWFETYVDYETLTPSSYALHVKESKQLRETRSVFDWNRGIATWWDKRIDSEQKVEEKKKEWPIPAYSQNIFTAMYYMRAFTLRPGKKFAYRVAHEGENLLITIDVLRREKLDTPIGVLDTVVVKPKIELDGVFRPVGDIFLWMTDDDRKFIVRIETKIKIGTIVGSVKAIDRGFSGRH